MISFSIVIPMFNSAYSIVKTLESCLEQTTLPVEIIVVDDCSSDDSFALVKQWMQKYNGTVEIVLRQLEVNSGPSKARNVGWEMATGEYVAFLDADDRFRTEKLETLVPVLRENPSVVLLGHNSKLNSDGIKEHGDLSKVSTITILKKNVFTTPAVVIKRDIKERFDETMRYTEDHDLWLRITQKYDETYYLDRVLTLIDRPVRSEGGQSANLWAMRRGEIKMYKKFCKSNGLMVLFPMFLGYSLAKHLVKLFKGRA